MSLPLWTDDESKNVKIDKYVHRQGAQKWAPCPILYLEVRVSRVSLSIQKEKDVI